MSADTQTLLALMAPAPLPGTEENPLLVHPDTLRDAEERERDVKLASERYGRIRAMQTVEEQLAHMGIPRRVRERWAREMTACTTRYQVVLCAECHQIEGYLIGRYGYGRVRNQ